MSDGAEEARARTREALAPAIRFREGELSGTLEDGRAASLSFEDPGRGKGLVARLAVGAESTPRLRVTLETWRTRLAKWLGRTHEIEVGDEAFDRRFLLETPDAVAAAGLLGHAELREAIERAFTELRVETLELAPGELAATLPADALAPDRWAELARLLGSAARTLDRVPVHVAVLDHEALALRGAGAAARCSYCHGDLSGAETDLDVCRLCGTVIHDSCFRELGRCPVLGCRGRPPRRKPRKPGTERIPLAPPAAPGDPAAPPSPIETFEEFVAAWESHVSVPDLSLHPWRHANEPLVTARDFRGGHGRDERAALAALAGRYPEHLLRYLVTAREPGRRAAMDILMICRELPPLVVLASDPSAPELARRDALEHLRASVGLPAARPWWPDDPRQILEASRPAVTRLIRQARSEGNLAVVPWLVPLLQSPNQRLREPAREAYRELTGRDRPPLELLALYEHWRPRAARRREVSP
jgi:hypothetical protein